MITKQRRGLVVRLGRVRRRRRVLGPEQTPADGKPLRAGRRRLIVRIEFVQIERTRAGGDGNRGEIGAD